MGRPIPLPSTLNPAAPSESSRSYVGKPTSASISCSPTCLWVLDVSPEPGGTALLVTLVAPDEADLRIVEASLDAVRGLLRSELAAGINRKRTPHLRLVVIPERALEAPSSPRHAQSPNPLGEDQGGTHD